MEYLHAGQSSTEAKQPRGVVSRQITYSPGIEAPRKEWFVSGTESSEIRLASSNTENVAHFSRILYPSQGTIIAMDPDIPLTHQRVPLNSRGAPECIWMMDGVNVGTGAEVWWAPSGGRHKLVLTDVAGNELDSVIFDVRGAILH